MLFKNKRNNTRIALSRIVGISCYDHLQGMYPTKNISLTGMWLMGFFNKYQGSSCSITFHEQWSDRQYLFALQGKVVRWEHDGIAIQYTEMSMETFTMLQTLLLYECINPVALGEEFTGENTFILREDKPYEVQTRPAGCH